MSCPGLHRGNPCDGLCLSVTTLHKNLTTVLRSLRKNPLSLHLTRRSQLVGTRLKVIITEKILPPPTVVNHCRVGAVHRATSRGDILCRPQIVRVIACLAAPTKPVVVLKRSTALAIHGAALARVARALLRNSRTGAHCQQTNQQSHCKVLHRRGPPGCESVKTRGENRIARCGSNNSPGTVTSGLRHPSSLSTWQAQLLRYFWLNRNCLLSLSNMC